MHLMQWELLDQQIPYLDFKNSRLQSLKATISGMVRAIVQWFQLGLRSWSTLQLSIIPGITKLWIKHIE